VSERCVKFAVTLFVKLWQIETHKLDFKEKAEAKIGSRDTMRRQVNCTGFLTVIFYGALQRNVFSLEVSIKTRIDAL